MRVQLVLLVAGAFCLVTERLSAQTQFAADTIQPLAPPTASATPRWTLEWSGYGAIEGAYYYGTPFFPQQYRSYVSAVAQPKLVLTNSRINLTFTVKPFVRVDAIDSSRSHADLREGYLSWSRGALEINAGVQTVSWGNMTGPSLINILNQSDEREDFVRSERLGQPMVDLGYVGEKSSFRLYVAPLFRPKSFPSVKSRLYYFPLPVNQNEQIIEHKQQVSLAARYTRRIGNLDLALSHFYGINRSPVMLFSPVTYQLTPLYRLIHQTGLETQWIRGNLTAKFEMIRRIDEEVYYGYNGGLEYTFTNMGSKNIDVTLFSEYVVDHWKKANRYPFSDSFFLGSRMTLGDVHGSELQARLLTNREQWTPTLNIEAYRRLSSQWKLIASWTSFVGPSLPPTDALTVVQHNHLFRIEIQRFL